MKTCFHLHFYANFHEFLWLAIKATNMLQLYTANFLYGLYRGSYMSAHVLLNLLNELGKRDKM